MRTEEEARTRMSPRSFLCLSLILLVLVTALRHLPRILLVFIIVTAVVLLTPGRMAARNPGTPLHLTTLPVHLATCLTMNTPTLDLMYQTQVLHYYVAGRVTPLTLIPLPPPLLPVVVELVVAVMEALQVARVGLGMRLVPSLAHQLHLRQ